MAGNKFSPPTTGVSQSGLPDNLREPLEALSGLDLGGVRVHYNSAKPAQLNAHAYAQGNDIHVAPGQCHHLAHEAWHIVQQKQGRAQPTGNPSDSQRDYIRGNALLQK